MDNTNILIAGVGGQGILLTSRVLCKLALKINYDVKVSEIHGMAQRGGSVVTYVKIGKKIYSPIIEKGTGDFLLSFEKSECLRWLNHLKKDAVIILNKQQINPMPVIMGKEKYPSDISKIVKKNFNSFQEIDAFSIAKEFGSIKAVNIVLLGVLAKYIKIDNLLWIQSIKDTIPPKFLDINLKAFEAGYNS